MTSFVIYAVYVASNVCFLRAVAARSVVHVRAFILGAPVCGVVRLVCVASLLTPFAHLLLYSTCKCTCPIHVPFLFSYDLYCTLHLPLGQRHSSS